jgi:hypothetical protein
MIVIEYTAPPGHDCDTLWVTENKWHCVLNAFEMAVDGIEAGEEINFNVKVHEMTEEEWKALQEDFIEP